MKKTIVIILILIIIAVFFYVLDGRLLDGKKVLLELTKTVALELVRDKLIGGECKAEGVAEQYRACTVEVEQVGENIWTITVIYEGFFDDSVRGSRLRAKAVFETGNWMLRGDLLEDFQCWPGRGHEDFSTELCV